MIARKLGTLFYLTTVMIDNGKLINWNIIYPRSLYHRFLLISFLDDQLVLMW